MDKESQHKSASSVLEALRIILLKKGAGTQQDLASELESLGLEVNQSTISRCLRKLGAIKTFGSNGEAFYKLPVDPSPPAVEASIADLVISINHNVTLIVIHSSPGSASLIARHLDHFAPGRILGTIAGDDTIFVAPISEKDIKKMIDELNIFFRKR
jgi:transcriptional regulator of arginine metabolism